MEDARITETGNPITAEDLWYIDNVEAHTYECVYCAIECTPCSYDKDLNKRRPYFRLKPLTEHLSGCLYESDDIDKILETKHSKIRNEDGKPGHYPSEFRLPKPIVKSSENIEKLEDSNNSGEERPKDSGEKTSRPPNRERPYATSSFRLLVNHYINFPNDRDLPLNAESINGSTFRTCFQSLYTDSSTPLIKPKNKIYYGAVKWSKPTIDENSITIAFSAFYTNENKEKENLSLRINTNEWSIKVRESFVHDYEKSRIEVIKNNGSKKLLVFFIGTQSDTNALTFLADNPLLLSFKVI